MVKKAEAEMSSLGFSLVLSMRQAPKMLNPTFPIRQPIPCFIRPFIMKGRPRTTEDTAVQLESSTNHD